MLSMPSSGRFALLDIRDNILLAEEFTRGLTLDQFKADRRTFYAVCRCLEIVSEAARRLPEAVRNRHPTFPGARSCGWETSTAMNMTTLSRRSSGGLSGKALRRC